MNYTPEKEQQLQDQILEQFNKSKRSTELGSILTPGIYYFGERHGIREKVLLDTYPDGASFGGDSSFAFEFTDGTKKEYGTDPTCEFTINSVDFIEYSNFLQKLEIDDIGNTFVSTCFGFFLEIKESTQIIHHLFEASYERTPTSFEIPNVGIAYVNSDGYDWDSFEDCCICGEWPFLEGKDTLNLTSTEQLDYVIHILEKRFGKLLGAYDEEEFQDSLEDIETIKQTLL